MSDLATAEALVEAGDVEGARALGEALLAATPTNAGAHNLLGFLAHREGRLIEAQLRFEHACALDPDDGDARANLEAVRARARRALRPRRGSGPTPAAGAGARGDAGLRLRRQRRGPARAARTGTDLSRAPARPPARRPAARGDLEQRLLQLPGATTSDERRFLCRFAAHLWDGRATCSRTDRCSAARRARWRSACSPTRRVRRSAQLQTFDWFYYGSDTDVAGRPVRRDDPRAPDQRPARSATWSRPSRSRRVFDSLHSRPRLLAAGAPHVAYLPGAPGRHSAQTGEPTFELPEGRRYSLVFIDGCKSWYGTRYTLRAARAADRAGQPPDLPGLRLVHVLLAADVHQRRSASTSGWSPTSTTPTRSSCSPRSTPTPSATASPSTRRTSGSRRSTTFHARADRRGRAQRHPRDRRADDPARGRDGLPRPARRGQRHIAAMLGRPELIPVPAALHRAALHSPTYTPEGAALPLDGAEAGRGRRPRRAPRRGRPRR